MSNNFKDEFLVATSWEDAAKASYGYEDPELVSNLVKKIKCQAPWEGIDYSNGYLDARSLELLCALQLSINKNNEKVTVADVGGGNGYMSSIARRMLPKILWDWHVFESPSVANAYRQFEKESDIKWYVNQFDTSYYKNNYDIGLISCTLQYIEKPYNLMANVAHVCRNLIIMRIPLLEQAEDLCAIQKPQLGVYKETNASWPCWFFSRVKFEKAVNKIGNVVYRWLTHTESITINGITIPLEGMLVRPHQ